MQKVYSRINWENEPSTNTPINEDNLNKMDYALDKIDDRVVQLSGYQDRVAQSEKNAKQSEINAKESEINSKESELKAKEYKEQAFSGTPEGYEALVNQVGLLDIATSTGNTLYNSKPGGYRLQELVGNTEQKTLSGKNKFRTSGSGSVSGNGLTLTYEPNTSEVVINGTATSEVGLVPCRTLLLPKGTYTASVHGLNVLNNTLDRLLIQLDDTTGVVQNYIMVDKPKTFTLEDDTLVKVSCIFGSGSSYSNKTIQIQIEPGEVATDFEDYCGGTPSPNPEYKQAIKRTFDCVEMIRGYYKQADGTYATSSEFLCSKHKIPCKEGDVIKLDLEDVTPLFRIVYYNGDIFLSYVELVNSNSITKTVPTNATHFTVTFRGFTLETVGKITLTVNGKYVGQIAKLGRNELDYVDMISGNLNSSGVVEPDSTWVHKIVEIDNACVYWLFNGNQGESPKHCWYDNDMKFISAISTTPITRLITPPSNAKYLGISFTRSNTAIKFQKQKVTTFFLNEPLRATDRIVRKDGVWDENHKRKTRVFDGSDDEGWSVYSGGTYTGFSIMVSDMKSNSRDNGLCNRFTPQYSPSGSLLDGITFGTTSNQNLYITFSSERFSTVDEFRAWLSENNVEVEYPLAEETYTPLDTESQIALNNMVTFDTITYIEVNSKVKPTSISGEYGTSQVGALALENANLHDTVNLTTVKGSVANNLTTTEEGFVLDARQGTYIDKRLLSLERLTLQYLNEPTLSNYTEPMRAIVENATDAPINDEFNNTALFEVETVQDSFGRTILMQRYTTLSQYAQAVKVRFSTYDTNWTLSDWIDS